MKSSNELKKIKEMQREEIIKEYKNKRAELSILLLKVKTAKEKNYSLISKKKRYIAKLLTVLNEKE